MSRWRLRSCDSQDAFRSRLSSRLDRWYCDPAKRVSYIVVTPQLHLYFSALSMSPSIGWPRLKGIERLKVSLRAGPSDITGLGDAGVIVDDEVRLVRPKSSMVLVGDAKASLIDWNVWSFPSLQRAAVAIVDVTSSRSRVAGSEIDPRPQRKARDNDEKENFWDRDFGVCVIAALRSDGSDLFVEGFRGGAIMVLRRSSGSFAFLG